MHLRSEGNRAYLSLDESATVADQLVLTHEDHREAWGMNFDFDADGRLVGVEFEDPGRQLPESLFADGGGLRAEWDEGTADEPGAAYLYLSEIRKGGVEHTLAFGEEETRAAWGIKLDFDANDRLLGIEFESDDSAPVTLLQGARRLSPPPAPGRGRLLLMRLRDTVRDLPDIAGFVLRERIGRRRRNDVTREDDQY
jgi:Protein of unknown function (DUF2283)